MKKIILVVFLLLLTGCYNYIELDDLAVVSSIGIDYQANNYNVVIEIKQNKKEEDDTSIIYKGKGISLSKAIENVSLSLDKTLYFVDLDSLIISYDTANKKMDEIIDYITRNSDFTILFNIIIAENPEEIIENIMNNNKIAGNYLKKLLNVKNENVVNIKYEEFLSTYLSEYKNVILPYATIKNNDVIIDSAALFNKKKIIYLLNKDEIALFNILNNKDGNYLFKTSFDGKDVNFKTLKNSVKISYQNNAITIKTNLVGFFNEMESMDINDENNVNKLLNMYEKDINERYLKFFSILNGNNSDPLGFKKNIYNKTKVKTKDIKNIKYKLITRVKADREGLIFNSMGESK